jgi:hypothetical protein
MLDPVQTNSRICILFWNGLNAIIESDGLSRYFGGYEY